MCNIAACPAANAGNFWTGQVTLKINHFEKLPAQQIIIVYVTSAGKIISGQVTFHEFLRLHIKRTQCSCYVTFLFHWNSTTFILYLTQMTTLQQTKMTSNRYTHSYAVQNSSERKYSNQVIFFHRWCYLVTIIMSPPNKHTLPAHSCKNVMYECIWVVRARGGGEGIMIITK